MNVPSIQDLKEGLPLHMFRKLPAYYIWLIKEIIMSNIATAKTILGKTDAPELFYVPFTQKTEAGVATYANSITLTPGTVTVDIDENGFLVHALSSDFGDDVRSGDMDRRVTQLEGRIMMLIVAMITLGLAVLMAIVRTTLGPTAFDRVLSVNVIGTLVILGIALHGFIMGSLNLSIFLSFMPF